MESELEQFLLSVQKLAKLEFSKEELDLFLQNGKENYEFLIGLEDVSSPDDDEPNSYLNLLASRAKRKSNRK
jgi:hypothetical protein